MHKQRLQRQQTPQQQLPRQTKNEQAFYLLDSMCIETKLFLFSEKCILCLGGYILPLPQASLKFPDGEGYIASNNDYKDGGFYALTLSAFVGFFGNAICIATFAKQAFQEVERILRPIQRQILSSPCGASTLSNMVSFSWIRKKNKHHSHPQQLQQLLVL